MHDETRCMLYMYIYIGGEVLYGTTPLLTQSDAEHTTWDNAASAGVRNFQLGCYSRGSLGTIDPMRTSQVTHKANEHKITNNTVENKK